MGLGPPVCKNCQRVADFREDGVPHWYCPCGEHIRNFGFLFCYPESEWERLYNTPPKTPGDREDPETGR